MRISVRQARRTAESRRTAVRSLAKPKFESIMLGAPHSQKPAVCGLFLVVSQPIPRASSKTAAAVDYLTPGVALKGSIAAVKHENHARQFCHHIEDFCYLAFDKNCQFFTKFLNYTRLNILLCSVGSTHVWYKFQQVIFKQEV